jgi:hypothetical protein
MSAKINPVVKPESLLSWITVVLDAGAGGAGVDATLGSACIRRGRLGMVVL